MCDEFLNNFALALLASLFLKTITMQIKVICMNWGREFLFSGRTFLWGSFFFFSSIYDCKNIAASLTTVQEESYFRLFLGSVTMIFVKCN